MDPASYFSALDGFLQAVAHRAEAQVKPGEPLDLRPQQQRMDGASILGAPLPFDELAVGPQDGRYDNIRRGGEKAPAWEQATDKLDSAQDSSPFRS
jgi:hypothetical protein